MNFYGYDPEDEDDRSELWESLEWDLENGDYDEDHFDNG